MNKLNTKFKKSSAGNNPTIIKTNQVRGKPSLITKRIPPIKLIGENQGSFAIQNNPNPGYMLKGSSRNQGNHQIYKNNLISKHGGNK